MSEQLLPFEISGREYALPKPVVDLLFKLVEQRTPSPLADKLIAALEKILAEAQVPDETTNKEDADRVCEYIVGFASEALTAYQKENE